MGIFMNIITSRILIYFQSHFKLCLIITAFFLCLLIGGCTHNPSPNSMDPTEDIELSPSLSPDDFTDSIDTDISAPVVNIDKPALLTMEQAKMLIMSNIDIKKYELESITSSLTINDERYYAFILKEGNVAYPPALIVNKDNSLVYCYEEDGALNPFDNFPLYVENTDNTNGWDGTFIHYNSSGNKTAQIEIMSTDDDSFMFQIISDGVFFLNDIKGSAEYTENTAVYSINDAHVLLFVILDNTLSITYTPPQNNSEISSAYMASFTREGIANTQEAVVKTPEEAVTLLLTLSKKQTKLPYDISSYILIPDKLSTYINGNNCYYINVYEGFADRKEFICTYYVAMDLSKIYMYDAVLKKDTIIYDAAE